MRSHVQIVAANGTIFPVMGSVARPRGSGDVRRLVQIVAAGSTLLPVIGTIGGPLGSRNMCRLAHVVRANIALVPVIDAIGRPFGNGSVIGLVQIVAAYSTIVPVVGTVCCPNGGRVMLLGNILTFVCAAAAHTHFDTLDLAGRRGCHNPLTPSMRMLGHHVDTVAICFATLVTGGVIVRIAVLAHGRCLRTTVVTSDEGKDAGQAQQCQKQ